MEINVTIEEIIEAVQNDDNMGFCTVCGEPHYGIEPDAREYECEVCGTNTVYGAEELLIMIA